MAQVDVGVSEASWPRLVEAVTDDMGPDFSGVRAHATLEMHMKECSERQAEVRANFVTLHGRLDAMTRAMEERLTAQIESVDKRMTAMSNRMWAAAGALIVVLAGGLASVVFYLLTRGKL